MSVDKFGRSTVSIAHQHRRTTPLVPSRGQLLSAGVLCKIGDAVDFKLACARNLGNPHLPLDAANKEYVDSSVKNVQSSAQAAVTNSLEHVIGTTFALTKDHLNEKLKSLNAGFNMIIEKTVEDKVGESSRAISKKIAEAVGLLETYKRNRVYDDKIAVDNMLRYDNDLVKFKEKLDLQDARLDRVDNAYTIMRDHVRVLENRAPADSTARVVPRKRGKTKNIG